MEVLRGGTPGRDRTPIYLLHQVLTCLGEVGFGSLGLLDRVCQVSSYSFP